MGRANTKTDLITSAQGNFDELNAFIASLSEKELATAFDFAADHNKTEAHWQRDKNLRDILIHLYEWHKLLLNWIHANQHGTSAPFLPPPYNWKTYGAMNIGFWQQHQNTTPATADKLFRQSHAEVMALAESFSEHELFTKNVFAWVGGSTLGAYFVSTSASHYAWALKKLKAHRKNCSIHTKKQENQP
ncbi:ClbS/DfsB family four-helix bundle protein [Pasteurella testudinis]|uniref:ClbS/DfsB family four-helix bundle protein n=1 Tax=Pasteurella testudinis TaxID=761 RepID=UPI004058AD56